MQIGGWRGLGPWLTGLLVMTCLGGCLEDPARDADRTLVVERQPLIDCTERQDTGYTSGNPFPITVVTVDGKPVERETANAFYVMQQAAAADGVAIKIVSGFRTYSEQQYLYNCYVNCNCNNCNLAARPGYSNHNSGHALDLNTSASGVYNWLSAHAGAYGFSRTVPSEPWHWEWWGGGPGGGPCGGCQPHCEGDLIVGADCGVGDCSVYGSRCVDDNLGVRCAFVFCPDQGQSSICLDDATIGNCDNGALSTGDCSAFAAYCSTAGVEPDEARCVSAFCVENAQQVPVAHEGCFINGDRVSCNGNGGATVTECPGGQVCSVYPEPHCTADPGCPAQGEARVCLDDTVIGECNLGSVLGAYDCATEAAWCDDSTGTARCVATVCLDAPGGTPKTGTYCVDEVTRANCTADGSVSLEQCPDSSVCVEDASGQGTCVEGRCQLNPDGGCTADGNVYTCDAAGNETLETCPSGQPCTIYPQPHCAEPDAPSMCPETGQVSICIDGGEQLGRCADGNLTATVDCPSLGLTCGAVPDGRVACISPSCKGRGPDDGVFCVDTTSTGTCNDVGAVQITRCPDGTTCNANGTGATCSQLGEVPGGPGDATTGSDTAGADGGADTGEDAGDAGVNQLPRSDDGCCAVVRRDVSARRSGWPLAAMLGALGLLGLVRRRRR